MTRDEFIATIIIMKYKKLHSYYYINNVGDRVTMYSNTIVTTINDISAYHTIFKSAIKRMSS